MPYVGAKLRELFPQAPTTKAVRDLAVAGGDALHDKVVIFSPIDKGNLKSSWRASPPKRVRLVEVSGYMVTVESHSEYAAHVEWGTGLWGPSASRYPIEPKTPGGVLSWINRRPFFSAREGRVIPPGQRMFARRVMHPGSPGQHMMARAVTHVEATFDDLTAPPILREWAREYEVIWARA